MTAPPAPSRHRSAVTNGRRLHVVNPGDTAWARRFKDVLAEITNDLSGADLLSEGQRQLIRRAATISIACEAMEGDAAAGAAIDLELYGRIDLGAKPVPGTVRLEFYNMTMPDALTVLAADEDVLRLQMSDPADVAELKRAARSIVDTHAVAVAERYATRSAIEPFLQLLISNEERR
jgi:hypothetical protein